MKPDFQLSVIDYLNTTTNCDTYHNILITALKNKTVLKQMTINQFASACFVSAPTITRVAHHFGCQSFPEFKASITSFGENMELSQFHISKSNYNKLKHEPATFIETYTEQITSALHDLSQNIDLKQIDCFLARLQQCENIFIFSYSTSYFNASLFQNDLLLSNKLCICPHTLAQQAEIAQELGKNDIAIVLTCYGNYLNHASELMKSIARSDAYSVLVTQNPVMVNATLFDEVLAFTQHNHIEAGPYIMSYGMEYLGRRYHALFHSD